MRHDDLIDAILRFRLYTFEEGGRPRDIPTTAEFFSCALFDGENYWDCRIWLDGQGIQRGVTYERPVTFLSRGDARKRFQLGVPIPIHELGFVGEGVIVS